MAKAGQRKCLSCGEFFFPDHRSGERQWYCCAADCRRASKAASQARWLARPPNNDYFSGPVHVARVQVWRAAHPGYARGRVRPSRALQDLLTPQVPDAVEECANRARAPEAPAGVALQDLLNAESPLLAYFSDRGRSDQTDRGRRFSVIVDARGKRASEGFTVSQSSHDQPETLVREAIDWGARCRLIHGGGRRLRRTHDAVGKSCSTLSRWGCAMLICRIWGRAATCWI